MQLMSCIIQAAFQCTDTVIKQYRSCSPTQYSARAQDGPQDMERNKGGARHSWARQHAWLLLSFFSFPVGHPEYEHCIVFGVSKWTRTKKCYFSYWRHETFVWNSPHSLISPVQKIASIQVDSRCDIAMSTRWHTVLEIFKTILLFSQCWTELIQSLT